MAECRFPRSRRLPPQTDCCGAASDIQAAFSPGCRDRARRSFAQFCRNLRTVANSQRSLYGRVRLRRHLFAVSQCDVNIRFVYMGVHVSAWLTCPSVNGRDVVVVQVLGRLIFGAAGLRDKLHEIERAKTAVVLRSLLTSAPLPHRFGRSTTLPTNSPSVLVLAWALGSA
jgi:hypothetical protein